MKVAWWCVFFLLFCNVAYSQAIELTGAIIIGKSEMMSYRIVYNINNKNEISGYSIADLGGDLETKSRISGVFNPSKKTLRFAETAILSTKAKLSVSDFCLMSVNGKFEKKGGKNVFTGSFISKSHNDKLVCESGTLILTTTKEIYKAAAQVSKAIDKLPASDSLTREIKARLNPLKGVENVKTLTSGKSEEYTLTDDTVQFDIFDDKLEDGDIISILKNNTTIIHELKTTNKVQSFRFVIRADEKAVTFTIVANNEGSSPPNTVKIVMTNGKTKELLISQLAKNQRVKLIFRRK
ncbi:MAG TPA: hypothetical protein PLJ84_01435 [Bacteroidales bacterium]|nr:hypothetical protein [Bacteroidales bacterium]HPT01231.1 hypothetical protein [Bacteroidales bacterium]